MPEILSYFQIAMTAEGKVGSWARNIKVRLFDLEEYAVIHVAGLSMVFLKVLLRRNYVSLLDRSNGGEGM